MPLHVESVFVLGFVVFLMGTIIIKTRFILVTRQDQDIGGSGDND